MQLIGDERQDPLTIALRAEAAVADPLTQMLELMVEITHTACTSDEPRQPLVNGARASDFNLATSSP